MSSYNETIPIPHFTSTHRYTPDRYRHTHHDGAVFQTRR